MDEPGNAKREFPKEFHETRLSWLSCIGAQVDVYVTST